MMTTATVPKTTLTSVTLKPAPIIDMGNGLAIPQVIYKGQPVLTAKAVAAILGCDSKVVQMDYRNNRRRFAVGRHVHVLSAAEAKSMGFINVAVKSNPKTYGLNFFRYSGKGIVLFSREGVALLATIVSTDEAWAMRQTFIDAYFTLEGIVTGTLSREEAAQKAHEVVSKGASLLPGINLQLAGNNAPKALESPIREAESLLKAALVSMGRAIGSNNMLERQKEGLEGQLRAASMGHAGTAA